MGRRDYYDEDRPSWREIDRRKDRSSHVSRDRSERRGRSSQSSWLQKQYRKEAEKLFMGKKGSDKHRADHSAIYESHGSVRFGEAIRTYLEEYGLPDDGHPVCVQAARQADPEAGLTRVEEDTGAGASHLPRPPAYAPPPSDRRASERRRA